MSRNQIINYFSWQEAKAILAIGSRLKIASLLMLVSSKIDRFVIVSFLDNHSIGLYTVAFTFASSGLNIITSSFQTILVPKLAQQENVTTQKEILAKGLRFNMLFNILCSIPLIILSPLLIPFLFGNDFNKATVPAIIIFLVFIPLTMRNLIIKSLYSLNKPRPTAINSIILTFSFGIIALPLEHQFNLIGILIALLLANLIGLYFFLDYLYKTLGLTIKDWWGLNLKTCLEAINISQGFVIQNLSKYKI